LRADRGQGDRALKSAPDPRGSGKRRIIVAKPIRGAALS
jgi:hypothetical protein